MCSHTHTKVTQNFSVTSSSLVKLLEHARPLLWRANASFKLQWRESELPHRLGRHKADSDVPQPCDRWCVCAFPGKVSVCPLAPSTSPWCRQLPGGGGTREKACGPCSGTSPSTNQRATKVAAAQGLAGREKQPGLSVHREAGSPSSRCPSRKSTTRPRAGCFQAGC